MSSQNDNGSSSPPPVRPAAPKPTRPPKMVKKDSSSSILTVGSPAGPARSAVPKELTIGDIHVGPDGISKTDGSPLQDPVHLDDLEKRRELGRGMQGIVDLYYLKGSNGKKKYAIKTISLAKTDSRSSSDGKSIIVKEIRNIFTSRSDNVVAIYNAFLRSGNLVLVQEYMDGGSMEQIMDFCSAAAAASTSSSTIARNAPTPGLPEVAVAYCSLQILKGLAQVHAKQKVIDRKTERSQMHRDVKPGNIMFSRSGRVKLADFGVACIDDSLGVGAASVVGTATYMSPQRIKEHRYTAKADVWSVGILAVEALLGQYPFNKGRKDAVNVMGLIQDIDKTDGYTFPDGVEVSAEAQEFVNMCLRHEESDRASAEELTSHPWLLASAEAGRSALVALMTERSAVKEERRQKKLLLERERSSASIGSTGSSQATPTLPPPLKE